MSIIFFWICFKQPTFSKCLSFAFHWTGRRTVCEESVQSVQWPVSTHLVSSIVFVKFISNCTRNDYISNCINDGFHCPRRSTQDLVWFEETEEAKCVHGVHAKNWNKMPGNDQIRNFGKQNSVTRMKRIIEGNHRRESQKRITVKDNRRRSQKIIVDAIMLPPR